MGALIAPSELIQRVRGKRVYRDSAPIGYVLENNPRYADIALQFTDASERNDLFGFTGTMALVELLVKPLREQNAALAANIKQLFASGDIFTCLEHPHDTLMLSAQLRAAATSILCWVNSHISLAVPLHSLRHGFGLKNC